MKRSVLAVVFALLGIVALSFGLREVAKLQAERARAQTADRELAELRARIAAENRRTAQAGRAEALEAARTKIGKTGDGAATDPSAADLEAGDAASLSIFRNPVLRALFMRRFGLQLDPTWGPLFAKLQLTPDQIAQFKAIMMANQQGILDLRAAMENQGIPQSDPTYAQTRSQLGAELSQQMQSFLGDQYSVYSAYHHDQAVLPIVTQVATALYPTDSPLTLDQSDQLVQLLAGSSQTRKYGFVLPNTVDWDSVLSKAAATFSPTQVAALQQYQAQSQTNQQIRQAFVAAQQAVAAGAPPSK